MISCFKRFGGQNTKEWRTMCASIFAGDAQKIEPDPNHPTYLRTQLNQGYVFDRLEENG